MTTYQDSPLQSRRAARQGERAEAENAQRDPSSTPASGAPAAPAEPLSYATTSRPPLPQYDGQSLRPRRTVESADDAEPASGDEVGGYRSRDFSPEGRRVASPSWAPQYGGAGADGVGTDGTVEFQTQVREQVPTVVPAAPTDTVPRATVVPATVLSPAEHTMTRRELRALREAGLIPDEFALVAPAAGAPAIVAPSVGTAPVEAAAVDVAPVEAAPVDAAPAPAPVWSLSVEPSPEPPAVAAWPPPEVPAAVTPLVEPIPLVAPAPQPSTRLDSALAEFDALAAGREPLIPAPDAPVPLPGRRAAAPIVAPMPPVAPMPVAPMPAAEPVAVVEPELESHSEPESSGLSAFDALFQPPSANDHPAEVIEAELIEAPIVEDQTTGSADPLFVAPAPQGAPVAAPPFPVGPFPVASGPIPLADPVTEPAVGHWSTQADLDDAEQVNETTISRSVGAGSGAITTSALVLPSIPEHTIGGALGDSGQILLTGSISLPESLSATGAHPSQLDESDMDHLLDPGDHQVASTDSTPVRAIRAVSTHTASGGIISPMKPKGTRGFTILIIAASAMAVVVVGLLVAGLVSGTL